MSDEELIYYVHALATSDIESFNSFLKTWAPKHLFFPKSYKMRIKMAVMHWNENRDLLRRELPRRDEPKKGKRARGTVFVFIPEKVLPLTFPDKLSFPG